jgi:hypothetical protein
MLTAAQKSTRMPENMIAGELPETLMMGFRGKDIVLGPGHVMDNV